MKRFLYIILALMLCYSPAHGTGVSIPQRLTSCVDVRTFGADPTGTNDSTSAITSAIDNNKGENICFPTGTYKVTTLTLDGSTYAGTVLDGRGSTINLTGTGNGITITDVHRLSMFDFRLRPTGASITSAMYLRGIKWNNYRNIKVGFFDETPGTWETGFAWGRYGDNTTAGITIDGNASSITLYNVFENITIKSIKGFGLIVQTADGVSSTKNNNNIFNGIFLLTYKGLQLKSTRGNYFNDVNFECEHTPLDFSVNSSNAITEGNIINVSWAEWRDNITWGDTTYIYNNTLSLGYIPESSYLGAPSISIPQVPASNHLRLSYRDRVAVDAGTTTALRLERHYTKQSTGGLTLGSDTITNGDMELDANWVNHNTPTTNERSSTQAHGGTYSRHIVTDSGSTNGVKQSSISTTVDEFYEVNFWIYPVTAGFETGTSTLYVQLVNSYTMKYLIPNEWQQVKFYDKANSTSHNLIFYCASQANEFYIDDVVMKPVSSGDENYFLTWANKFKNADETPLGYIDYLGNVRAPIMKITDGVSTPTTESGLGLIYIDSADGSLKIRFGSGTIKTLTTDP